MDKWLVKKRKTDESDTDLKRTEQHDSDLSVRPTSNEQSDAGPSNITIGGIEDTELEVDNSASDKVCSKRKYKGKRYKFNVSWLRDPLFKDWLEQSQTQKTKGHDMAHCKVCDVQIVAHRYDIFRHGNSERHKQNFREILKTKKLTHMVVSHTQDSVKRAELKLAGLLAANNLPFLLMDTLSPLCADIFPDSEIAGKLAVHRTKATALVKDSLGKCFGKRLHEKLSTPGCFFSIIMDETTDISAVKQCAFTVIYYDKDCDTVKTNFFDMVEMKSGTAEDLYQALKQSLVTKHIPFSNLVGFSSDTTNVMVGEKHSVFSLLKQDFPNIVCVKCSCHMIHLAASNACLRLPRSVEDFLRNIGSHFSRSYSRQVSFQEFQEFFHTEIHKIISPATTRWLSLKACVDRVLEQYTPLKMYLRDVVFQDPSRTNEEMLHTMGSPFTEVYLEFMSYNLGVLTNFNTTFQSEVPMLHKLKPELKMLLKNICSNFLKIDYVRKAEIEHIEHENPSNFVELEMLYLGIQAQESINNLKKDEKIPKNEFQFFFKSCLSFYIELITQIKKRFRDVLHEPFFDMLSVVDPQTAQTFQTTSLNAVLQKFPILLDFVDAQEVDKEWRAHALLDYPSIGLNSGMPAEQYWKTLFGLKNAAGIAVFSELRKVFILLLVLPFSNASVERIFSKLKDCKTDHRNKLKTETIVALLHTKQGIEEEGGCVNFNPDQKMLHTKIWE